MLIFKKKKRIYKKLILEVSFKGIESEISSCIDDIFLNQGITIKTDAGIFFIIIYWKGFESELHPNSMKV